MNLKEDLKGKLSEDELSHLTKSYDLLGNIAIIEIPDELKKREKIIAEALLKNNGIKTVLKKAGKFKGRLRTRKLVWLAGNKTKETEYIESACRFRLNVENCYFSPRLGSDRLELAKQVGKGEKVLVMFSGVGPYPIVIAKHSKAKEIFGVELGKEASKYAALNVKLNKLVNVKVIQGDVRKVVPRLVKKEGKFDRIVMARPQLEDNFLDVTFQAAKKGTILHFYDFLNEKEIPQVALKKIWDAFHKVQKKYSFSKYEVLNWKKCGDIGPRKHRLRVDFKLV